MAKIYYKQETRQKFKIDRKQVRDGKERLESKKKKTKMYGVNMLNIPF